MREQKELLRGQWARCARFDADFLPQTHSHHQYKSPNKLPSGTFTSEESFPVHYFWPQFLCMCNDCFWFKVAFLSSRLSAFALMSAAKWRIFTAIRLDSVLLRTILKMFVFMKSDWFKPRWVLHLQKTWVNKSCCNGWYGWNHPSIIYTHLLCGRS